jgi:hypothetical protein
MLRPFGPLALGLAVSVLFGCSGPSPAGEKVRETSQPIVNGSYDGSGSDDGIVAVLWTNGQEETECTGTVIAINGLDLYILTAAHCCAPSTPPQIIVRGPNYNNQGADTYPVLQYLANPSYTQGGNAAQPYDFCMITAGLGNHTAPPIISAMTPSLDNVTTATPIIQVGFGQTVAAPEGTAGNNSLRNEIGPINIAGFEPPMGTHYQAIYDETQGGTCFGDSGGPDLANGSDGQRHVYGVHSFVSGNCNQQSGSGIVSYVYTDFIATYLAGQPPVEDCNQCQTAAEYGTCSAQDQACGMNSECVAYINCLQGCGGTSACVQSCGSQHPSGVADYNALVSCICNTACPMYCAASCGSSSGVTSTGAIMLTSVTSSAASGVGGGSNPGVGGGNAGGGNSKGNGGSGANGDAGNNGGCATSGGSTDSHSSLGLLIALSALALRRRGASLPETK